VIFRCRWQLRQIPFFKGIVQREELQHSNAFCISATITVLACNAHLWTKPGEDGHGGVMDDVKGGQLVCLLSQHEKDGVRKINELGEEEPPGHV
jgi:hypothetical protein